MPNGPVKSNGDSSSNVNATAKRRLANDNFDHFWPIFRFFSPFLAFLAIYIYNHLSPFRTLKILKFNLLILNNSKFSQSLKKKLGMRMIGV